jgi:hypothetical protein
MLESEAENLRKNSNRQGVAKVIIGTKQIYTCNAATSSLASAVLAIPRPLNPY